VSISSTLDLTLASKEELLLELAQLEAEVQKIISGAKYLIRYSLVHKRGTAVAEDVKRTL